MNSFDLIGMDTVDINKSVNITMAAFKNASQVSFTFEDMKYLRDAILLCADSNDNIGVTDNGLIIATLSPDLTWTRTENDNIIKYTLENEICVSEVIETAEKPNFIVGESIEIDNVKIYTSTVTDERGCLCDYVDTIVLRNLSDTPNEKMYEKILICLEHGNVNYITIMKK